MSLFRRLSEQQAGAWVSLRVCECVRCGFIGRIRDGTRNGMPSELVERKLRQIGWVSPTPAGGICPKCADAKPAKTSNEKFIEIFEGTFEPMAAQPPREPTAADRRRIRDALDEHYIEDKGCYRQSFSDKALAAKLTVPAKWVSDLRELGGYGPDKNEDANVVAAEVAELRKMLTAYQNAALEQADAIEKRIKRLEVKGAYAA